MARPSEDDREAIDRAFAELVAGYHLTADRPDPLPRVGDDPRPAEPVATSAVHPDPPDAAATFTPPPPKPEPAVETPPEEHYEPEPLPPMGRPGARTLVGWIGIGFAVLVVIGRIVGLPIPIWVGWLAVVGFIGGFGLLVSQLPRTRSPEDGDGAVV
jgi:hypothetical protein